MTSWRIRSTIQCKSLISHEKYSFVLHVRAALIKEATNKNQDFQNALQSLDFFLMNLPNNKVKPTDDATQIAAKKYSQEVRRKYFMPIFFVGLFLLFTHYHIHTNVCVRSLSWTYVLWFGDFMSFIESSGGCQEEIKRLRSCQGSFPRSPKAPACEFVVCSFSILNIISVHA